ncbi:hypothetical protein JTE90_020081 [Oedothorax gibbosus]|uniref:Uncharacterized protein n=1 Tax=Oedothorax gibbosus TaxID=931172 RepID=A0AAV6USB3_9ARAC|nr:hypothetical protein JTE90_020081 [Oedothorax gibbosus]
MLRMKLKWKNTEIRIANCIIKRIIEQRLYTIASIDENCPLSKHIAERLPVASLMIIHHQTSSLNDVLYLVASINEDYP